MFSKIARSISTLVAIALAGCAQLADLLGNGKAVTRTNSIRAVSATIAPSPEEFLGGTTGTTRVKTPAPAPATSATLVPATAPTATPTEYPWGSAGGSNPTPSPSPDCEAYDGTTPTLRANLEEVRPGIDRWPFQSGCLGWGTQKFTIGNPRRVDLNGWGKLQTMSNRYDVVGGSLFVEMYLDYGRLAGGDMLYPDRYDERWRFRLSGIDGRVANFERVKKIVGDMEIGDGVDPENPSGFWEGPLQFARWWAISGSIPDVVSISTRTNSDANPSGYDRATLSEPAAARWGADTLNVSCIPFEGVEQENLSLKTAVGDDLVLFGRGEIGRDYFSPYPWANANRLEGHGREDIPTGFLLLGTKDGKWGQVMDDLFEYPQGDPAWGVYWPRPRYIEQQQLFFYRHIWGNSHFYSFTPEALLKERKEVRYSCP